MQPTNTRVRNILFCEPNSYASNIGQHIQKKLMK